MPGNPHKYWIFESLLAFFDCSLCGGEACDRNAEGRAGYVVEADLVAELNGNGVAAVLTADTLIVARITAEVCIFAISG